MNSPDAILASFIIPVYRTPEDYLHQCLDSILGQGPFPLEVLLIDDGSPDDCPSLCDRLAQADPRIQALHQTNSGVSSARNTGIEAARGTWICFVDADDWLAPDYLERFMSVIADTGGKADIAICNYLHCVGNEVIERRWFNRGNGLFGVTERAGLSDAVLIIDSGLGQVWSKLYRRDFLLAENLRFHPQLSQGEDIEFNYRAFVKAQDIVYLEKALYHYRFHEASAGRGFKTGYADAVTAFVNTLREDVVRQGAGAATKALLAARSVNALLTISMNYLVHENHPGTMATKRDELANLCRMPAYAEALATVERGYIGNARYLLVVLCRLGAFRLLLAVVRSLRKRSLVRA